jgi:hypothetical protein
MTYTFSMPSMEPSHGFMALHRVMVKSKVSGWPNCMKPSQGFESSSRRHGRSEKSGEHRNVAENHGHNLHVIVFFGRKYGQNIAIYHFLCAVVVCTGWTPAPKAFGRWRVAKLDALGVEDDSSGPHGCDQEIRCGSSMSLKLKPGDFRHRLELPSSHQRWWFQPGDVLSGHYKAKETPKQP